jgi:predicted AlkP superfamily pyrophosphatase or phosphodiesterase
MKIKSWLSGNLLFLAIISLQAQTVRPKLAVGIVIDQMRMEYLYRFSSGFGNGGFNRLLNEGFVCYNTQINYLPTVTGPGHASIYTGTTPKYHGICGNDWFDRDTHHSMYCASDSLVETVGNNKNEKGSFSARNVLVPTLGDVLKLSTAKHGKVYAISLKDRAAAFPAGHAADGAFWFDKKTGNFVSSTYYMNSLPDWLTKFNRTRKADSYLDSIWKPFHKADSYRFSLPEKEYLKYSIGKGLDSLSQITLRQSLKKGEAMYEPIYASPFGNKILTDLAIETIRNTELGKDAYPDLLAISYSSTDVVGHAYGPLSKELNDTYLRLDTELARLLDALDKYVGKGNYVLFLTADHGMSDIPGLLTDNKIPGGYLDDIKLRKQIDSMLVNQYGPGKWVNAIEEDQIYLNHNLISQNNINLTEIQNRVAYFVRGKEGIADAYTANQLTQYDFENSLSGRVQKGFCFRRGGDVLIPLMPGWMATSDRDDVAATHGSGFNSDTNIPLIWFGSGIPEGHSYQHYNVTDIAPTVSALLHIMYPTAAIGNPITDVLK